MDAYVRLSNNISGSRPNSLFNDVVEELEIKFENIKKTVDQIIKLTKISVDKETTFGVFKILHNCSLEDILEEIKKNKKTVIRRLIYVLIIISETNFRLCFNEIIVHKSNRNDIEKEKFHKLLNNFKLIGKEYCLLNFEILGINKKISLVQFH
jgi:hypothetical protein